MTRLFKSLMAGFALAAAASHPAAAQSAVCLNNQDVVSTSSTDGKTLVFRMRDGRTYINHLRGGCPGLKFNGFIWELRGINEICENRQSLRVLNSGEVCMLGKFDAPLPRGVKPPKTP